MPSLTEQIKELAHELGFDKVGITAARQPAKSIHLKEWLQRSYHGTMQWMNTHQSKRISIQEFVPGARSVICVACNYNAPEQHPDGRTTGKISRYAWGEDYHKIIKKKLKHLLSEIKRYDPEINGRLCVDTAPIMEKLWAEQAGIGWQGKHTNLITREYGSWVFLGEIVVDKVLDYDAPAQDHCGTCRACMDACPTRAIIGPNILDARKCIAYLTIEYWDAPIPENLQKDMNGWIFGCDICQNVCPWNSFSRITQETRFLPGPGNVDTPLQEWAEITESSYKKRFKKSPVSRPGWNNFIRNVNACPGK